MLRAVTTGEGDGDGARSIVFSERMTFAYPLAIVRPQLLSWCRQAERFKGAGASRGAGAGGRGGHLQGLLTVDRTPRPDPGRGALDHHPPPPPPLQGFPPPLELGHIWEGFKSRVVGLNPSRGLGPAGAAG